MRCLDSHVRPANAHKRLTEEIYKIHRARKCAPQAAAECDARAPTSRHIMYYTVCMYIYIYIYDVYIYNVYKYTYIYIYIYISCNRPLPAGAAARRPSGRRRGRPRTASDSGAVPLSSARRCRCRCSCSRTPSRFSLPGAAQLLRNCDFDDTKATQATRVRSLTTRHRKGAIPGNSLFLSQVRRAQVPNLGHARKTLSVHAEQLSVKPHARDQNWPLRFS